MAEHTNETLPDIDLLALCYYLDHARCPREEGEPGVEPVVFSVRGTEDGDGEAEEEVSEVIRSIPSYPVRCAILVLVGESATPACGIAGDSPRSRTIDRLQSVIDVPRIPRACTLLPLSSYHPIPPSCCSCCVAVVIAMSGAIPSLLDRPN